jgi:hypothetical protein
MLSGQRHLRTVRRRLAEHRLKPWRKDTWCIPQVGFPRLAKHTE